MFKKSALLTFAVILSLASAASAFPGCPRGCHGPQPPITERPSPKPSPEPKKPLPPVEDDCIDSDGDGEEDDECQSIEVESLRRF